jgi:NADPH2:quinone reductase
MNYRPEMAKMKIVRYREKGPPEVLTVEEETIPIPGGGEVLVRVEAAGVNYGDVLRRSGRHYPIPTPLPHAPGSDVIGVVDAIGNGVEPSMIGRRVFATARTGAYAEYAVGPANRTYPVPEGLDPIVGIALMSQGCTAALILKRPGRLQPGESVLVPAAAGGVGSMAVQLAKLYGAGIVVGLASTPAKRAVVSELGADAVVDYTQDGWATQVLNHNGGSGVDLALEMSGGPVFYETLQAVRAQNGRMVVFGNASDNRVSITPDVLLARNMNVSGFMLGAHAASRGDILAELSAFVLEGKLKVQIGGVYSLAEAPQAHRAIEARTSVGKLVITPGQSVQPERPGWDGL